ncbi:aspartate carbamoyltransferase [Patescibacteria group bacterium]|nr:aspartate carbamoyltransferase [Patescibacteria group bacterium]
MKFQSQHILDSKQFDREGLLEVFKIAKEMEEKGGRKLAEGKILATLFYEPSTRTRFSFETAMLRLGGGVVSGSDMVANSSHKKGESLEDTGRVVSRMADMIAMRHPEAGSVEKLASGSRVPVINAGDGVHEHPTQALLDVYTIWKEFDGKLEGLKVGMVGDLKNGRVPHSQYNLLKHFGVSFVFVAPEGLQMPEEYVGERVENLAEVISELDVIAMTRVQKERFTSEAEAEKYAGAYVLDSELMGKVKKSAIVIHPLPRVDEIAVEVDDDGRARYFDQVENGVAVRMALICLVLGFDE